MDEVKHIIRKYPALVYLFLWIVSEIIGLRAKYFSDPLDSAMAVLAPMIYMGIICCWCFSLRKRITDRRSLRYMLLIGGSLWLFLLTRMVKYSLDNAILVRVLWYSYYILMLLIPNLFFWLAGHTGRRENTQREQFYPLTLLPTLLLIGGVLTNDLHQQAFRLSGQVDSIQWDGKYSYGPLYFVCVVWIFLLTLAAILMLYRRCRRYGTLQQLSLPFGVMAAAGIYCGLYIWEVRSNRPFIVRTDLASFFCLFAMGLLEACIQSRLLPSNTGYDWCFNHSTIHARILDEKEQTVYQSAKASFLEKEELETLRRNGRLTRTREDSEVELIRQPIPGGALIWEREVSQVNRTLRQLEHNLNSIEEVTEALSARIETEAQKNRIRTQNRLYSQISRRLEPQLARLRQLLEMARDAEEEDFLLLMRQVTLLGVYIKRSSNLLLLREQEGISGVKELKLALQETFDNLADSEIRGKFLFREPLDFSMDAALRLYEFLELILEGNYFTLKEIYCIVTAQGMTVQAMGGQVPPTLDEAEVEQEKDSITAFLPLEKGGTD